MLWVIVALAYFAIGGLVAGLLDERSADNALYIVCGWPLLLALMAVYAISWPTMKLGEMISEKIFLARVRWKNRVK